MIDYKQQLEQLRGTANGDALRLYLEEEMKRMSDIYNIKDEIDLRGKQEAKKILENLFKFLEVKKAQTLKNKYN